MSLISNFLDILIFCAVVLTTVGGVRAVERAINQRRRLGEINEPAYSSATPLIASVMGKNRFFQWVLASTSISDAAERRKLNQALILAGYNHPNAAIWYVICRFSLAIALPTLFLLGQSFLTKPVTGSGVILWPLLLCGLGLMAPSRILAHQAGARKTDLEFEFPDALDLMVVCVEAGLSLDATFVRVGHEIRESHPRISTEFEKVSEQLRAGRARPDALRSMADRTGVSSINSFVALLIQTEMLGSGIAQTLRTFSSEMRQTRFLKAEEKAMRIPVLMTIPLVGCILPVIVTAALLPAIIDVVQTVLPALNNAQ